MSKGKPIFNVVRIHIPHLAFSVFWWRGWSWQWRSASNTSLSSSHMIGHPWRWFQQTNNYKWEKILWYVALEKLFCRLHHLHLFKISMIHNSGLDLYWIPFLYHYSLLNHLVLSNGNQEYNQRGKIWIFHSQYLLITQ